MTAEPDELIARALVRIRRDQQAGHLQKRAAAPDAASFRYLDALDEAGGPLPISAIADRIGVDRPRASRLTTALLTDGLITREPQPGNARYILIQLTAAGRAVVAAAQENRRRGVAEALTGFSAEESRALATLLARFVDAWPRG
ncbi:MarR family winged helix-turn-helix transcriptional regulator [Actinoplanes awajinensis]|uniref:HTH marR-type domain-containing protein n=1 Tax=Actinoplanes awajinensis subsp. mycoplanecinus TaxID=135947 RepID=A0A101JPM4_9ACTN|nr:MarR family transcriptional regulator [Actinoplanes awajinensis]KUL30800.1 hypothetical protein ADL15_22800 [Actinoplanes awajinensis subsp. mycoplanecinus]